MLPGRRGKGVWNQEQTRKSTPKLGGLRHIAVGAPHIKLFTEKAKRASESNSRSMMHVNTTAS